VDFSLHSCWPVLDEYRRHECKVNSKVSLHLWLSLWIVYILGDFVFFPSSSTWWIWSLQIVFTLLLHGEYFPFLLGMHNCVLKDTLMKLLQNFAGVCCVRLMIERVYFSLDNVKNMI